MIYKGKEYDDNQILEILNNRDNDILTYKEKLDSVQAKITAYENDITTKDKTINELKIKRKVRLIKKKTLMFITLLHLFITLQLLFVNDTIKEWVINCLYFII